jgi:hypothetical protein
MPGLTEEEFSSLRNAEVSALFERWLDWSEQAEEQIQEASDPLPQQQNSSDSTGDDRQTG